MLQKYVPIAMLQLKECNDNAFAELKFQLRSLGSFSCGRVLIFSLVGLGQSQKSENMARKVKLTSS